MNCSCFAKTIKTNWTQGLFESEWVLYNWAVPVCGEAEKEKQITRKTEAGKRLCKCTDVHVYVVYNLPHVKTERTFTPVQLQTLFQELSVVIISQQLSFVPFAVPTFVPPSVISRYLVTCSDVWYQPLSHILPKSIVNRITSAWRGSQNRFCLFQWLLIRLHDVNSLGLKQLNEFFITRSSFFVRHPRDFVRVAKKQNTSRHDPLRTFLRTHPACTCSWEICNLLQENQRSIAQLSYVTLCFSVCQSSAINDSIKLAWTSDPVISSVDEKYARICSCNSLYSWMFSFRSLRLSSSW